MKAILEFNLPEDQKQFEMANQSADMYAVICHLEERSSQNKDFPESIK